ncbi:MAG: EAL domain-containing protein [Curvibacter sp.]|nr:EAL domain-containing protein [Curvibacter sp.]
MDRIENRDELALAQQELLRANRLYAMLSQINRTIVRSEAPDDLFANVCRIALEHGGFSLAWICLLEPASARSELVACAGGASAQEFDRLTGWLTRQQPMPQDGGESVPPIIVNDALSAAPVTVEVDLLAERLVRSGGAFPICRDGDLIGTFHLVSAEADFFKATEVNLMSEVAADISYALNALRHEERRIAAESKMRYQAYYDAQTGVPSRAWFEERLADVCAAADTSSVQVLVADLRQYHGIVQLLSPAAGIELIRTVARQLEAAFPGLAMARVMESKFAFLLRNASGLHEAEELAWQIHQVLARGMQAGAQEMFLAPFIGIASYPQDSGATGLLRCATVAADSKAADANALCSFYSPDLDQNSRRWLDMDSALRRALERKEFVLHYQPQVDLRSGRIVGAEALLRWNRPGHGLVPPMEFIGQLEESGLIEAVGEWVMQEACRRRRAWQDQGLPPVRVAVNLSARQFHDDRVPTMVRRALGDSGLDPGCLELELTESVVLTHADQVIRTMRELNATGVSHALDDFGTGYSSLSYLQRLPVARIKIDKSFVTNLISSASDAAIARAVIGMAHSLGLAVIAEGVETQGQLGYLRSLGCEEMQGYLFSRPLPETEFLELLAAGRGLALSEETMDRVLLLVDDEPNILTALKRTLRREGYRVLSTNRVAEGFELLGAHRVGVVICDQRMPEMTGTEFLRRTKALYPDTVRIVLSGYTELNSIIDAVNRGAVYKFITKPWDDEVLLDSVRDAFRMYEIGREHRAMSQRLKAMDPADPLGGPA